MLILYAMLIGAALDLLFGDPAWLPHPVVWMGRYISGYERRIRPLFPKTPRGELWGGALLLAFEHLWHGEIAPWFPFLTAMSDPAEKAVMFHEMATVGVAMAALTTAIWLCMLAVAKVLEKKAQHEALNPAE